MKPKATVMIQHRTADPEITNSQNNEELESQHNSQLSEQVNYGTQPEETMECIVDYDWDENRKIKYLYDENGLHRV